MNHMNICQVVACRQNLRKLYHLTAPGLVSNLFEFLLGVQMLGINVLLTEAA